MRLWDTQLQEFRSEEESSIQTFAEFERTRFSIRYPNRYGIVIPRHLAGTPEDAKLAADFENLVHEIERDNDFIEVTTNRAIQFFNEGDKSACADELRKLAAYAHRLSQAAQA